MAAQTRVVVVTGANQGIGLELCRQLVRRGDTVHAACRKTSPELDGLNVKVHQGVDVTSDSAVESLAKSLQHENIDILINNAGILKRDSLDTVDYASVEEQFAVNAVGPLRVTRALLPMLKNGSKIAIITSRMGSIGDNGSGGYYGYRMSKTAVNMASMSLAHDLKPKGISVVTLHPGMVATRMTSGKGITPEEAARGVLTRLDELSMNATGSFRHAVTGETLPW